MPYSSLSLLSLSSSLLLSSSLERGDRSLESMKSISNELRRDDVPAYQAAKQAIAEKVIAVLERHCPGIRSDIEVVDVSTPAMVIRFTGNEAWKVG